MIVFLKSNLQRLIMKNIYRQIHMSIVCLSQDIFHVQDNEDFQKQILNSRKPFLVDFYANW